MYIFYTKYNIFFYIIKKKLKKNPYLEKNIKNNFIFYILYFIINSYII